MKPTTPPGPVPAQPTDDDRSLSAQILPLLLLTAIFFINFIARVCMAPLAPEIEKSLHLSHAEAGSLFFMMSAGYFVGLLGAGWIASRLSHRYTVFTSAVVLGFSLLSVLLTDSIASLRGVLFLVGIAAGMYLPSGIATISRMIAPRHLGKAYAVHELAPNLGFVVAPLLAEAVMVWFSWKAVLLIIGVTVLLAGAGFLRFGRGGDFRGNPPGIGAFKAFFIDPAFWIMTLLFTLGISSTLGVYTMLPLFLVNEHAIDRDLANTVVALSRVSGLFMALVGGWMADRFGARKMMMAVFLLTGIATILVGAVPDRWVLVAVFIQPLPAVCFFPAGFAALSRVGPAGSHNLAVSLTIPIAFLVGGGAVPTLIGFMGDTVSFAAGIMLVGGAIACGMLLAYRFKSS